MDYVMDYEIKEMIKEQGDAWLGADGFDNRSDRLNAVVITDRPDRCFRVTFADGGWTVAEDVLTADELAEFFAAFGSHWALLLHSWLETGQGLVPVRAFTKNSRKRGGFSVSVDMSRMRREKQSSIAA